MKKITGTSYSIEWGGYNCPDGWPRVLAEMFMIGHLSKPPDEIMNFPHSLGGGYFLTIQHVPYPLTPLKPEVLMSVRKKRVERRIKAKVPLLADHFIAEELKRKPEYYAGITDNHIEADRNKILAEEWQRYKELLSRPGLFVIHANEPEECKLKAETLRIEMEELRKNHPGCK